MKRLLTLVILFVATFLLTTTSQAAPTTSPAPNPSAFTLEPFTFLGDDASCDVQALWRKGEGLGTNNDPDEYAIYLKKGCTTDTIASAGIDIVSSLEGGPITALQELNFYYRTDGHCGAGAPRFNVEVNGNTYFLGCTYGTHTPVAGGWEKVVFDENDFDTAGIPNSGTLNNLYIIFDEGIDQGQGFVYLDNISINGDEVGAPSSTQLKQLCKLEGWKVFTDPTFKNQGDCVSYFQSNQRAKGNRKNNPTTTKAPSSSLSPTVTPSI